MKKKDEVIDEIALADPPALSKSRNTRLAGLDKLRDEDIDTSDIPEADEDFWSCAVSNPFFRPV